MKDGERAAHSLDPMHVMCIVCVLALLARISLAAVWAMPTVQAWSTVFAAICIQAAPYVVFGVALSTGLAVLPVGWLQRALPRRAGLGVPLGALMGAALPGCECGSVPVAAGLIRCGVGPGPAVALMLSAPATNPVVLAATATAFPGEPVLVAARFVASMLVALAVGFCQRRRPLRIQRAEHEPHGAGARPHRLSALAAHDLGQSLGLLTIGAASAATLTVLVPQSALDALSGNVVVGVVTLAVLAVVLAVCSEADAFIASSLTQFSRVAQLTFMVVGPAVDLKLIAMQIGAFGARFAVRVSLLSLVLAVAAATGVALLLL